MEILNASEGIEVERAESVLGKIPYSLVCLESRVGCCRLKLLFWHGLGSR